MRFHHKQLGLSAIELVIIIAVVALLVGLVVAPLIKFRQQQALQNSTNAAVSVLNEARTKTLAAVNDTSYSVRIESDRIILFTGTTYSSGASTNETVMLETPVTAIWSVQGGGSAISFARLTGTTAQYGTLTVSLPNGTTRVITIAASGSIVRN